MKDWVTFLGGNWHI